jgi:hypothetical protein
MVPRWLKLVCMASFELRRQGFRVCGSGPSSPPDGGLPLVGVKVVPPRRCAAAGVPSGLLRRVIRAGRYEEGCGGVRARAVERDDLSCSQKQVSDLFDWFAESEPFAGPVVEFGGDPVEVLCAVDGEVGALGKVLAEQAV